MCIKESEYYPQYRVYLCKFQVFACVTDRRGRYRCQGAIRSVHLKTEATLNTAICNSKCDYIMMAFMLLSAHSLKCPW